MESIQVIQSQNQALTTIQQRKAAALQRIDQFQHSLDSTTLQVVQAYQAGTLIREVTDLQIIELLNRLALRMSIRIQPGDEAISALERKELVKTIKSEYAERTVEEIELAYKWNVTRKLGIEPYRELKEISFGAVMAAYDELTAEKYRTALDLMQIQKPEPTKEPTPEELKAILIQTFETAMSQIFSGVEFQDYGNYLYDELDQRGLIEFSGDQKKEFIEMAGRIMVHEKENDPTSTVGVIEKYVKSLHDTQAGKDALIIRAKRYALNAQFKTWGFDKCLEVLQNLKSENHVYKNNP